MNRTKQAMAASLKRLLRTRPINKITIGEIAADCGVSRMTFYYHFRDIYDLIEWTCEADARAALSGNRTADTWQAGFLSLLEAVRENKPLIDNVLRAVDLSQLERYLLSATEKLLLAVIGEEATGLPIGEEAKRYVANFFKYGFVGVILDWIAHDMREEPARIVEITGKIVQGDFRSALERLCE